MNQAVAQIMKIQTFRSYIRSDQNADGRFRAAEIFYNALLLCIAHTTRNLLDRRGLQPQISPQMFRQIIHGFDALGKDHNAVTRIFGVPSVGIATQKFQQFLIAHEVFGRDLSQSSMQLF